jgi:ubiquinone/menaquinone biosynthesis C-methylase UbiE
MREYEKTASLYDPLIGPALNPIHKAMVDILAAAGSTDLVDICCGTGLLAGQAARAGITTLGVDISPHMLRIARDKRPTVAFLRADATALPLPDNAFGAAAISFALHEKPMATAKAILTEARRVVRSGGHVIVADYQWPAPGKGFFTGKAISLIERLAGQEHHACFRQYMEEGGAAPLLSRAGLTGKCVHRFMHGWAGLYVVA